MAIKYLSSLRNTQENHKIKYYKGRYNIAVIQHIDYTHIYTYTSETEIKWK